MSKHKIYQTIVLILYILVLILFMLLSIQSGSDSGSLSGSVADIIKDMYESIFHDKINNINRFNYYIRKIIGHYGFFLLIGLLSSMYLYSIRRVKYIFLIGINFSFPLIYAFISEYVLQSLANNRNPSFNDVWIDYAGFLTSGIILTIIFYFIRRKNNLIY
ncbi:MAG: VanZ family protein [Anaeroplasmataceae bacterium]